MLVRKLIQNRDRTVTEQMMHYLCTMNTIPMQNKRVEMRLSKNDYLRFEGDYLSCKWFEIVRKPQYEIMFRLMFDSGLWTVYDGKGKEMFNNFELVKILSYCVKMLRK